jgi:hypothetical protein
MMKTDRVTKMYDKLTNKERAVLAFRYMLDMNETEIERIEATVPHHTYRGMDLEYQSWRHVLVSLAFMWAIEYWQFYVRKVAAIAAALRIAGRGEPEEEEARFDMVAHWSARLVALDRALDAVCEEHGFDAECIRKLAGAGTLPPLLDDIASDEDFQAEVTAQFSDFVTRVGEKLS